MTRLAVSYYSLFLLSISALQAQAPLKSPENAMSSMGRLAHDRLKVRPRIAAREIEQPGAACTEESHQPCAPQGPFAALASTQAEVSIAVDSSGQHIVLGFNDFRGFANNPLSVSGFMYSDDGGLTFVDGGQLPSPGNQTFAGLAFPLIFGDADVKYLGACNFIYSSLMVKVAGAGLVQTLGIHKSTDCGHTWTGPVEVVAASNPGGNVDVNGNAVDAADKELMDVDPETGRVLIGWSNFTETSIEISTTYIDNIMSATPTFGPRTVVNGTLPGGQGSSVRFAGNGSPRAYITWVRRSGLTRRIVFSRSTDNGLTWSPAMDISAPFVGMDQVLGNDRVNEFPSLAVDKSAGAYSGYVYVVNSNNNSLDAGDVMFQRSIDGGVSFSAPIPLNNRPGDDRAQWFPFVSVDKTTGRVHVFYYDQGVDTSGDLSQVSYLYSDDGGVTWSMPAALSDRPFKAGWGNDPNQPNLGDYNQSVAQLGMLYAGYAATRPQGFADGQPSTSLLTPDVYFSKVIQGTLTLGLQLGTVTFTDSGTDGAIDPGDSARFRFSVMNRDVNPLHAKTLSAVTGVLSSSTPGVTVTQASSAYPNIVPGATVQNTIEFVVAVSSEFVPGTPIELELTITANGGTARLAYTQATGTLLRTTLLSETFDTAAPGSLPAGWTAAHGAGANTVPWRTSNTFCGTSNKAFHPNANDGPPAGSPARWERLFSPIIVVPGDARDVEVEFDVCYDAEDEPLLRYTGYDGFFLRATDLTPGRAVRSVLVEAFEEEFTTGSIKHYPRHFPRNDDPNYFEDMSAWSGDSQGLQHVRLKLPGMAGSTVQFRFEYAQDSFATCADVRPGRTCGVAMDNFVVRSVRAVAPVAVNLVWQEQLTRDAGGNILANITVRNTGTSPATNVRLTAAVLGTTAASSSLSVLGTVPAGGSLSTVVVFPPSAGAAGAASVLRINGLYDGGSFGGSLRVTIP